MQDSMQAVKKEKVSFTEAPNEKWADNKTEEAG